MDRIKERAPDALCDKSAKNWTNVMLLVKCDLLHKLVMVNV
ncbi:hypothetical protein NGUA31_02820 [Salmonella enterica]|nr:Uncharacterised protein [Salmonella enterica subsp. enterica serovar Senftenberg]CUR98909.1 Uncharacterised protein [Salmonella enterica subsp. enterica serovar Weltevreden]SUE53631.1 Uncharacterised protein [Salmonella enterica subsp. enterica serovar Sendai]SUF31046.1 Uncharacterised protein [Salmonella enterica]SUG95466.1 Uncharacterised protein [Salmonella enterica subsp. enterica]SUH81092.1 Uncharacterised protein [Salmonella enterica subsp. enterica serovar Paratyphi A]